MSFRTMFIKKKIAYVLLAYNDCNITLLNSLTTLLFLLYISLLIIHYCQLHISFANKNLQSTLLYNIIQIMCLFFDYIYHEMRMKIYSL